MIKYNLILITAIFFLTACIHEPQSEYPRLETGIGLTQTQIDLQNEYDELYQFVDSETQQYMENSVKPLLERSRNAIHVYNQAVLADRLPQYTEREIRMMFREISYKLLEVQND